MTVVHLEQGYLEPPYAVGEYLSVQVLGAMGCQFQAVIDYQVAVGAQFKAVIDSATALAAQLEAVISTADADGVQFNGEILDKLSAKGLQFNAEIQDAIKATGLDFSGFIGSISGFSSQFQGVIAGARADGVQFSGEIQDKLQAIGVQLSAIISTATSIGAQFQGVIDAQKSSGLQFNSNPYEFAPSGLQFSGSITDKPSARGLQILSNSVFHEWAGYLVEEYLVEPYFDKRFHARAAVQFIANLTFPAPSGLQFNAVISKESALGLQFTGRISKETGTGVQFDSVRPFVLPLQFKAAIYNTDNLRILLDFPSRGTGGGMNWTTNSVSPGDFSVNNLNTDIVEQVYRSAPGTITGVKLECDTGLPQGVFIDTLAILNHNLTTSATVLLEGDDDPLFGSPGFSETLIMERINSYWISPDLPVAGYRYWRFSIDDPTNTNNYISIGTIIFGESVIFAGECFANPVRLSRKHFSDKVYTEGFTNVANDRAFKKTIGLNFQSLRISGGNYTNLINIVETAKTNLKCLWIPTPKYPSRYAVFGKLPELPSEEHNDLGLGADYVTLSVEVDESL